MLPSRAPLLIVPIRDRRQSRRILTIKNCAITMLSVAVVFASISIYNQTRRGSAGEYGRLFRSEVPAAAPVERKSDVIDEGPVADQIAPDPMLAAPAAREQVFLSTTKAPVTPVAIVPVPVTPPPPPIDGHGAAIVGDDKGVTVVKARDKGTPPPVLSGGIFKKQ